MAHKVNSKPLCMMNKALHDLNSELFPLRSGSLFSYLEVHHSLCHRLIHVGFPWKQTLRHIELECRSLIRPWSWDYQDKKGKEQKGAERQVGLWQVICWSQLAWKSAGAVNQGFPSSPQRTRLPAHLWLQCNCKRPRLNPQSVWKLGRAFRVVLNLRWGSWASIPLCYQSLDVDFLWKGTRPWANSSAEAVPKEGWQLKAACRHLPGSWGSKSFKRSLPQVPYGLRICSSLSTTGSAGWGGKWQSEAHV